MPIEIRMEKPNPKQEQFFKAKKRFILYGGARGGGKSWSIRKKAILLALRYPKIKILILRHTFPELRENHILPLMADLNGIAKYKDSEKAFIFPNKSRIKFGYCDNDQDVTQYQGQEYDIIFMDEATQFSEYQFICLTACLRGVNEFPKRFYLTANPGGIGHAWVKRLFIDKDYKEEENPEEYEFIKATVQDNKVLQEKDPGYIKMLKALPEDLKKAWLYGNWDIFAGQYFNEFNREIHVIEPFEIQKDWRRYFVMDYGLDMLAGYWIAVDGQKRSYVYREVYESGLIITEAIRKIKENTTEGEKIFQYIAPPDMWNRRQDTGKSVADIFSEEGIYLTKAQNNRVQGWYSVKEWLKVREDDQGKKTAGLLIFKNCLNLIRCMPLAQHDGKNPNDVATEPHEITHSLDAIRYYCAGLPAPKEERKEKTSVLPFALRTEEEFTDGIINW